MSWTYHETSEEDGARHDPAEVFAAGLRHHHIANTAYPIAHAVTMRPYRAATAAAAQELAARAWDGVDNIGLYVHIPFCEQRCAYCEYCVVEPEEFHESEDEYFDLLAREFELYHKAIGSRTLIGFDIGGGTPSAAKATNILRVVELAHKYFTIPAGVDISIETTPRIAAKEPQKIRAYYEMGIRRISMGVQTVSPALLEAVGRPHSSLEYNRAAVAAVRAAGFTKFNVDVMYGFAGQQVDSVAATIRHVVELGPEFVTLYRMRYKGTKLSRQGTGVKLDDVNAQYELAKRMLAEAGYEGSPGKNTFSRVAGDPGTSHYLTRRVVDGTPYLGLGLGAQTLSETSLAYNAGAAEKRLGNYRRMVAAGLLPVQDVYHLSREAAMGKFVSVAFYFGGVNLASFARKFGRSLEEEFPEAVRFVLGRGLMEYRAQGTAGATLRLTEGGVRAINGVISLFYSPAVQSRLIELPEGAALDQ
eukprot:m51a1_g2777 putative oxygen-independent coproporphyrinogen iii oxidase (474) ;mRNA; r:1041207-1042628